MDFLISLTFFQLLIFKQFYVSLQVQASERLVARQQKRIAKNKNKAL